MNDNMTRLQEMIEKIKYDPELDMNINSMRNELTEMLGELAHFKKLQQQGKLVSFPCKPGDIVYEIVWDKKLGKRSVQEVPFTPQYLNSSFQLNYFTFATKEEAEGHILLCKKMDIANSMKSKFKELEAMSWEERYEALMKLCCDICNKAGNDILSAEFVSEINDWLEAKIPDWGFITLPADVQFESQAWLKMQKGKTSEEFEQEDPER